MKFDDISSRVIGAAIEVHRQLGPGLLESTYEVCLVHELGLMGLRVEQQKPLPVAYKGLRLEAGYRIDLLVNDYLIVEIKSVEAVLPVHLAQLITYLRLAEKPVGLLLNFNVKSLKDGLTRVVNDFDAEALSAPSRSSRASR